MMAPPYPYMTRQDLDPDRRKGIDRRRRATPFPLLSALTTPARRRGFRRDHEGREAYVDQMGPGVIFWAIALMSLSALDAALTLVHIHRGGDELVPTMRWALDQGEHVFLLTKLSLTALGCVVIAAHQNFRVTRLAMPTLLAVYVALMAYHLTLLGFLG